jgi:hypothetical protein
VIKWAILSFVLVFQLKGKAQTTSVEIQFFISGNSFDKAQAYINNKGDTFTLSAFRFYLSNMLISSGLNHSKSNRVFLIDIDDPSSWKINVPTNQNSNQQTLFFNLGIDSLTSTSGAHGGDLDPTKGMYWAWQSGYINFKIEGYSSSCDTRKNKFQFHIGGYQSPYNALQSVQLPIEQNSNPLILKVDLAPFFNQINLKKENSIMIPGMDALRLAEAAKKMFTVHE